MDPSTLHLDLVDLRRTRLAGGDATLLSSHAGHPRPATSDTTKGSQAIPADSLKESQLAARSGPSPRRRTTPTTEAKQQASKQQSRQGELRCCPRLEQQQTVAGSVSCPVEPTLIQVVLSRAGAALRADRHAAGWAYTFLNRRLSTTSLPLPPLVLRPAHRSRPGSPCSQNQLDLS